MADKKILNAVKQFEKELELAQEAFARDGRSLEQRANRTIMGLDQMNVAFDMIHEGARITAELFASCEMIVLSLDEICRPLLDQKPGIKAVGAVVDLIAKVNDVVDETNTNFTVSLNGSAKSDVGTMQPLSSMQVRTIQKYWESYYRRMPEYTANENAATEKRAELKATIKAKEDEISAQKELNEELRKQAKELTEKHMKQVEIFQKSIDSAIAQKVTERKKEIAKEKEMWQKNLQQAYTTLNNLGLFKFAEKKELRQHIVYLESKIDQMSSQGYGMEEIDTLKDSAKKAVANYRRNVENFCDKFLSTKTETIWIQRAEPIPPRRLCSREEKTILNEMYEGAAYTASDLVSLIDSNYFPTTSRITPVLSALESRGYIEKIYDRGRCLYKIAGEERMVSYEVVTLNTQQMKKPCPQPPCVDIVLQKC